MSQTYNLEPELVIMVLKELLLESGKMLDCCYCWKVGEKQIGLELGKEEFELVE